MLCKCQVLQPALLRVKLHGWGKWVEGRGETVEKYGDERQQEVEVLGGLGPVGRHPECGRAKCSLKA